MKKKKKPSFAQELKDRTEISYYKSIRKEIKPVCKEKQLEMQEVLEQNPINKKDFKKVVKKWNWNYAELKIFSVTETEEKKKEIFELWEELEDEQNLRNLLLMILFVFSWLALMFYVLLS